MSSSPRSSAAHRFILGFDDGTLGLVGAAILLLTAVLWTAYGPSVEKTDFSLTYVGAKIVHDGMGRDLYGIALQKHVRDSLFQHPVPLFFEHPPFEALLFSPLAAHSFRQAYLVWGTVNVIVWLALIVVMRSYLPWPREALGYISMWLLFAPLWVALYQGQSSLLLLMVYALTFVLLKREKMLPAGFALGLGLMKFQFVLPFALIFVIRRKWQFLAGFGLSALVLAFLSVLTVGWGGLANYARFVLAIGGSPQNVSLGSAVDMPTIHGFIYAILGHALTAVELNIIVGSLSIMLLGWVAWRWESAYESSSDLMFAAAVAASLLSGLHMFTHDFSPLILPMLLVAGHRRTDSARRGFSGARVAIWTSLVLFWTVPIYFVFVRLHCLYLMGPVLLLFAWGATQAAKRAQKPSETLQAVAN